MMNSDPISDFSHIWDFIGEGSTVDVHADLQPQSSSCSSSSSSSLTAPNYTTTTQLDTNPNNYSFHFINTNPTKTSLTTRSLSSGATLIHQNDDDDLNSILFPECDNLNKQKHIDHDPLSFLNFDSKLTNKSHHPNNSVFYNNHLQQAENIDDFLIDFRQPDESVSFNNNILTPNSNSQVYQMKRSQSSSALVNSPQSQILTPPGSASSVTSHHHDISACIESVVNSKNNSHLLFHTKSASEQHMTQNTTIQQQKLTSPGSTNKNTKIAISKSPNSKKTPNLKQQMPTSNLAQDKSSIFVKTQSKIFEFFKKNK